MANKNLPASIRATAQLFTPEFEGFWIAIKHTARVISNQRLGRSTDVISHPTVRFSRTRHIEFMDVLETRSGAYAPSWHRT